MKPLTCLQPGWKPAGPSLWIRTPFPDLPLSLDPLETPEHLRPNMWANESTRTIISIDPGRLTMSCWASHLFTTYDAVEQYHHSIRLLFIGDERPDWIWRKGTDVALQGWEHQQKIRHTMGDYSPWRRPDPVYAWHYADKDADLL